MILSDFNQYIKVQNRVRKLDVCIHFPRLSQSKKSQSYENVGIKKSQSYETVGIKKIMNSGINIKKLLTLLRKANIAFL